MGLHATSNLGKGSRREERLVDGWKVAAWSRKNRYYQLRNSHHTNVLHVPERKKATVVTPLSSMLTRL